MTLEIGKGDYGYLNGVNNTPKPSKSKTSEVSTSKPVGIVSSDVVERKDLDLQNPYGVMGLSIKKPATGTVESFMQTAPEFQRWKGEFTLTNPDEASYILGIASRVAENSKAVEQHLSEYKGFGADLFRA